MNEQTDHLANLAHLYPQATQQMIDNMKKLQRMRQKKVTLFTVKQIKQQVMSEILLLNK